MSYAVRTIGRLPNQGEPYRPRHGRKINQNNSLSNISGESPAPTLGSAANHYKSVLKLLAMMSEFAFTRPQAARLPHRFRGRAGPARPALDRRTAAGAATARRRCPEGPAGAGRGAEGSRLLQRGRTAAGRGRRWRPRPACPVRGLGRCLPCRLRGCGIREAAAHNGARPAAAHLLEYRPDCRSSGLGAQHPRPPEPLL